MATVKPACCDGNGILFVILQYSTRPNSKLQITRNTD